MAVETTVDVVVGVPPEIDEADATTIDTLVEVPLEVAEAVGSSGGRSPLAAAAAKCNAANTPESWSTNALLNFFCCTVADDEDASFIVQPDENVELA